MASTARAVLPPPDGCYPNYTTAEGCNALSLLTTGAANTGVGWYSLFSAREANFNTSVGAGALALNISDSNTAVGTAALLLNTGGEFNTAVGTGALLYNASGDDNTAIGFDALTNNTMGVENTALGFDSMRENTTGIRNTALGFFSLVNNTEGDNNTAIGRNALQTNQTGNSNTAIGNGAGISVTGNGNVCIGGDAFGVAGVDNTTWISNVHTTAQSFSAGVNDYVTVRLSDGRLGHTSVVSSRRYKEDIKPLAAVSEALYALNPVSFRLKKEYDETQRRGFGLIAEEVETIDPDLVYHNDKGQPESVRYELINAMLLNEFLKEHRRGQEQDYKIQEQETIIAELRSEIRNLAATLNEHASELRKVRAQLQTNRAPAQEIASNSP